MLELEARRRIYAYLETHPGTYMRKLARELRMPLGTLEYHLHHLERHALVSTRVAGRFKAYFPKDGMDRRDKDVLAWIRQAVPRRVVAALLLEPRLSHAELARRVSVGPSTLTFHVQKLLRAGLLLENRSGRRKEYQVVDPDRVANLLLEHRTTFLDHLIDQFAVIWADLRGHDALDEAMKSTEPDPAAAPPVPRRAADPVPA